MRFDVKKFAWAATLGWAIWYSICAFLVGVAPDQFQSVLSFAFHYDLAAARTITLPGYLGGLIGTSGFVWLFVATIGWIYAAVSREQPGIVYPKRNPA